MGMSSAATTTVTESQFHVLAVDDSPFDRMLIERMLKTSSFQVTTVESGSKALEFLGMHGNDQNNLTCPSVSPSNRQEVRLVITDYCMPEMTGYDLLKKIKESSYLKDIPVVIISSENVPSRISRCLEEGAEEFLLKPMKLSDVNKLRQLMQTRLKDQKQEIQEKQELQEVDLQTVDSQLQQLQQERLPQLQQKVESKLQQLQEEQLPQLQQNVESKLQHLQQEQLPPQQQQPAIPVNNKRKTMEDGLPQERARPKYEYDGLAAVV